MPSSVSSPKSNSALIIYATGSKIPRRVIVPDHDAEILDQAAHTGAGESALMLDHPTLHSKSVRAHVAAHHGIDESVIPSGVCAVVGPDGIVLDLIMADPAIDTHPAGKLIASDTAEIGKPLP